MGLKRRTFLKSLGLAGGVGLSMTELFSYLASAGEAKGPDKADRGPLPAREGERWPVGVCGLCPGGCGIVGRIVDDKLVRLRGAPFHPLSRGGICPRGAAGTQLLYHPRRLLAPQKRTGKRGEGKFETISWEQALTELASGLSAIGADTMVVAPPATGQVGALRRAVVEGATFVEHRPYYEMASPDPALFMTQGIWGHAAYDLAQSDLVLSFGSRLLERFWHPCETSRIFGDARGHGRCRLLQVESHRSITGMRADRWVPIKPGTEATLALGLAHVIIKEGRVDRAFIEDHTFGYEDWTDPAGKPREGFRTRVLRGFDPRTVSDATGVPIDHILGLARQFATAGRSVALGSHLPGEQPPATLMAIHCLNALVGAIERPGGVLVPHVPVADPLGALKAPKPNPNGAPGLLTGDRGLAAEQAVALRKPKILVVSQADVLGEAVDRAGVQKSLEAADLVVVLGTMPDATTQYADLVLPVATYLEQLMDVWDHTSEGCPIISLSEPMLPPRGESRAEGDIWLALAKQMKRKIAYDSYRDLVRAAVQTVYARHKGELFGPSHHQGWLKVLESSGWRPPSYSDFDSFWEGALEVGGWWDPVYYREEWRRVLATPSGKFEFYSQSLAKAAAAAGGAALEEQDLVPHQAPIVPRVEAYPLALELFTPPTVGGLAGRLSWLRGLAGMHATVDWQTWVEVNPVTAQKLRLQDGAPVRVISASAGVTAVLRHSPATPPDTASIPCGLLATDTDANPGAEPLVLLKPEVDRLTGAQVRRTTQVTIQPV